MLTSGKQQMIGWSFTSMDKIKYCYMKAIANYKQALKHSKSPKDKARVYILIGQAHMCLAPRLYERD